MMTSEKIAVAIWPGADDSIEELSISGNAVAVRTIAMPIRSFNGMARLPNSGAVMTIAETRARAMRKKTVESIPIRQFQTWEALTSGNVAG